MLVKFLSNGVRVLAQRGTTEARVLPKVTLRQRKGIAKRGECVDVAITRLRRCELQLRVRHEVGNRVERPARNAVGHQLRHDGSTVGDAEDGANLVAELPSVLHPQRHAAVLRMRRQCRALENAVAKVLPLSVALDGENKLQDGAKGDVGG